MHPRAQNILVTDDEELVREFFADLLEEEGYNVILAESGAEALQVVAEEQVDLVLLDVTMPGMSGLDVLASLRSSYTSDELPVIMVTALAGSQDVVRAFEMGADDYVTKPFENSVALARIQARLRPRRGSTGRPIGDESWAELGPGSVLEGKYRLESQIGEGHFGVVFRAVQIQLRRPVAIKVLRTGGPNEGDLRARFQQEGMSTCRIEHPNAVTLLDFSSTESGVPYLVMELLEGRSLDDEILASGRLGVARCVEVLGPVCEVLAEAHEVGIIHRDIKPQNIFLHRRRDREQVKVLDFGLARLMEWTGYRGQQGTRGIGPGTPLYMAPERFCELPSDERSDVYSLGVTLYEMLSGRPPFVAANGSPLQVAKLHLCETPRSLRETCPEIPESVDRVVLNALAKRPEDRPGVRRLARWLSAAVASWQRPPAARVPRRMRRPAESNDGAASSARPLS